MSWWPCASTACGDGCTNSGCDGSFLVDCFDVLESAWSEQVGCVGEWSIVSGRLVLTMGAMESGGCILERTVSYPGGPTTIVARVNMWSGSSASPTSNIGFGATFFFSGYHSISVDWNSGDVTYSVWTSFGTISTTVPATAVEGGEYKMVITKNSPSNTTTCFYLDGVLQHSETLDNTNFPTGQPIALSAQGGDNGLTVAEFDNLCIGVPGGPAGCYTSASASILSPGSEMTTFVSGIDYFLTPASSALSASVTHDSLTTGLLGSVTATALSAPTTQPTVAGTLPTTGSSVANSPLTLTLPGLLASAAATGISASVSWVWSDDCKNEDCTYKCTASAWVVDIDCPTPDCTCGPEPSSPCGAPEEGNTENVACFTA